MAKPDPLYIYHIVHNDRLGSIIRDGFLWSDNEARKRECDGTVVGMTEIKDRRLGLQLSSHQGLTVGQCVPFYFCPRSVMLYLLHMGNREGVTYRGGQDPIVHLVARVDHVMAWAQANNFRWAFTTSNAGSNYFEDYADAGRLDKLDWVSINAQRWSGNGISREIKEAKQAEFLVEQRFPWELVSGIGVRTKSVGDRVTRLLGSFDHRPVVAIRQDWYY